MAESTGALARRIFDAFERRDGFALRECFAEDAVWNVAGRSRLAGEHRGRRAIIRFLGSLPRLSDGTYRSELIDVLERGERAVVLYRARGTRNGVELDIDQLLLFTIRAGVVVGVDAYPSDPIAFDAFWA
jgi:ketosteroid isomerase-like protein